MSAERPNPLSRRLGSPLDKKAWRATEPHTPTNDRSACVAIARVPTLPGGAPVFRPAFVQRWEAGYRAPFGLVALGVLVIEARVLSHERAVSRMSPRRRAVWVVVGCLTTAAIGALGGTVLFFALLFEHCSGGC